MITEFIVWTVIFCFSSFILPHVCVNVSFTPAIISLLEESNNKKNMFPTASPTKLVLVSCVCVCVCQLPFFGFQFISSNGERHAYSLFRFSYFHSFDILYQIHAICSRFIWTVESVFVFNFSLFSRFVCQFTDQSHIFHAQIQQSLHFILRFIFESPEIVCVHRIFNCHTIVTRHKYGIETKTKQKRKKSFLITNVVSTDDIFYDAAAGFVQCSMNVRRYCEYECYVCSLFWFGLFFTFFLHRWTVF